MMCVSRKVNRCAINRHAPWNDREVFVSALKCVSFHLLLPHFLSLALSILKINVFIHIRCETLNWCHFTMTFQWQFIRFLLFFPSFLLCSCDSCSSMAVIVDFKLHVWVSLWKTSKMLTLLWIRKPFIEHWQPKQRNIIWLSSLVAGEDGRTEAREKLIERTRFNSLRDKMQNCRHHHHQQQQAAVTVAVALQSVEKYQKFATAHTHTLCWHYLLTNCASSRCRGEKNL